ncbi:MAG: hypothetical protein ACLPUO_03740 [Streptosporangiaceae bacterium]|jgi:hypothetical protein
MATARGSTIATATTSTSTRPAHAGAPEERADGERDRGGGQRDIDEQTTAGGRVRAWCLDSGEAIPAQNIGAGGNQLGPGKRPQQIHQRGQVAAGQPLAELDADVAAAAVPALAQGHSGYFQADIAGVDDSNAVRLLRLADPRFHLKVQVGLRVMAGHGRQELEAAADPDERSPGTSAQSFHALGADGPAVIGDPLVFSDRSHGACHTTTLRKTSLPSDPVSWQPARALSAQIDVSEQNPGEVLIARDQNFPRGSVSLAAGPAHRRASQWATLSLCSPRSRTAERSCR